MKILIVNAVLYTSETKRVKKVETIKNCMIYDLCLAFRKSGHDITLIASDQYKPVKKEEYPFNIIWMKTYFKKLFSPNKIPCNLGILNYLKKNKFDLIISSESFQLNSLFCVMKSKRNTVIWQEMAFHQKMAKQLASKFWHNVIFKLFFNKVIIIPRSRQAYDFISKYSKNVSNTIIEHGVNTDKFIFDSNKEDFFVVSSQLIERKHIDKIIIQFGKYLSNYKLNHKLYIIGDGELSEKLKKLSNEIEVSNNVIFLGRLDHKALIKYLSKSLAMLVYTSKDNSMISIAESISVGTPIITTCVPNNAYEIKKYKLGIAKNNWNYKDLYEIFVNNKNYIENCKTYRNNIDNMKNVEKFIKYIKK